VQLLSTKVPGLFRSTLNPTSISLQENLAAFTRETDLKMSRRISLSQLAARMGYDDENYLVWLKAWLTEPLQLKAWADYIEGRRTDRKAMSDKEKLVKLVTTILEKEDGKSQRELVHHSQLTHAGVEARFILQFVRGCQTRYWLWKGWADKEKMASIAFDVLECLEHEFSDGEVGTSTLARAMMSAAAIHKVCLEGFPVRSWVPSPGLSGSPHHSFILRD
jgi:hypothetical protein